MFIDSLKRRVIVLALPKNFVNLLEKFPEVGTHYKELSESCYNAGPLDRKTAHLIKLGMSIALMSEGGVHSHVRLAKEAGATKEEIEHSAGRCLELDTRHVLRLK